MILNLGLDHGSTNLHLKNVYVRARNYTKKAYQIHVIKLKKNTNLIGMH